MAFCSRNLAGCLLAAVTALATGCMPRGPFPLAILFGEGNGPDCRDGDRCCHRHHGGRRDRSEAEAGDAAQPPLMVPISNFHPVPTRPVFTPWVVDAPVPEEISGQLAWKHAVNPSVPDKPTATALVEQPSGTPIARRPLPPPASLPDEKPVSPRGDRTDIDSRGDQSSPGWHPAESRF